MRQKLERMSLVAEQLEKYLRLARIQEIDSVISISNQFSALPGQHPVSVGGNLTRSVELRHWSWMYILTEAKMLIDNDDISNPEQKYILTELVRFLSDEGTGVNSFVQMPEEWKEIVSNTKRGTNNKKYTDIEIQKVIGAWHQEGRDICLQLSRNLGIPVNLKLSRNHESDPTIRFSDDAKQLCKDNCILHIFKVSNAATYISVLADLRASTIKVAMNLDAPEKPTVKGQVSWLLNQLHKSANVDLHITLNWKGRNSTNTFLLKELLEDKDEALSNLPDAKLREFEVTVITENVN